MLLTKVSDAVEVWSGSGKGEILLHLISLCVLRSNSSLLRKRIVVLSPPKFSEDKLASFNRSELSPSPRWTIVVKRVTYKYADCGLGLRIGIGIGIADCDCGLGLRLEKVSIYKFRSQKSS